MGLSTLSSSSYLFFPIIYFLKYKLVEQQLINSLDELVLTCISLCNSFHSVAWLKPVKKSVLLMSSLSDFNLFVSCYLTITL